MAVTRPQRLDYTPQGGRQFENVERSLRSVGDVSISNGHAVEVSLTGTPKSVPP